MKTTNRLCQTCGEKIDGRSDKLFCSDKCRSAFNYQHKVAGKDSLYAQIDKQLKRNRALLKNYNAAGKAVVRKSVLLNAGFNPKFFTHYWKNKKGDVYLFCYEYGFLARTEHAVDKYVLVQWQDYMEA